MTLGDQRIDDFERSDGVESALAHWLDVLRRRKVPFTLTLAVVAVLTLVVMLLGSSPVRVTSSVIVDPSLLAPTTDTTTTNDSSGQAQLELATSEEVKDAVTKRLGYPASITASMGSQDGLVVFESSEATAGKAALVANTYAQVFAETLQQQSTERFDAAIEALDAVVKQTEEQLAKKGVDGATQARLESELAAYQSARSDLRVQAALAPLGVARIIAPAATPSPQSWLRKLVGALFVGLVLGLVCAVIVVTGLETLDNTIRNGRRVIPRSIPILATIPAGNSDLPLVAGGGASPGEPPEVGRDVVDAYLVLRNALMLRMPDAAYVLHVVGASEGDRAAQVAANLAVAFAHADQPTVVVDLDPRRTVTGLFTDDDRPTVQNLRASQDFTSMSQTLGVDNLALLKPGASVGGDLLYRREGRALLAKVLDRSELVLVVTGPLGKDPSASAMTPHADMTLLVLTPYGTRTEEAQRALDTLQLDPDAVVAVVLQERQGLVTSL